MGRLFFSPDVDDWSKGGLLEGAVAEAGLEYEDLMCAINDDADRLEAAVMKNREDQLEAGHWGFPLFVHNDEVFSCQDHIVDLVWHLEQSGLTPRV